MDENAALVGQFERQRAHLRGVAFRMLGSRHEADDAVQEAWLRLSRSDAAAIQNLNGWLTTVVARVCLDMLRSRKVRGERPLDDAGPDSAAAPESTDPERGALLADSMSLALLTVLETLTPAERVSFVLHDMFDLPFDHIAPVVGKSSEAARQLASRARRRVRGQSAPDDVAPERKREIVEAFLAASRRGDFAGLLALLDPDVVLRADAAAVIGSAAKRAEGAQGVPELSPEMRGSAAVATVFSGRARRAHLSLVDGVPGAAVHVGGAIRAVFLFVVETNRVREVEIIADPSTLRELDIVGLEPAGPRPPEA